MPAVRAEGGGHMSIWAASVASNLYLYTEAFVGVLFFLATPHYFIVLLGYAASQLVLFFLRHIVMAV